MDSEPLLTAHDAVKLVRERTGIPLTRSRLHKDSMLGIAPRPAAKFGKAYLWRWPDIHQYALSLLKQPTDDEWELLGEAANRALRHLNNRPTDE